MPVAFLASAIERSHRRAARLQAEAERAGIQALAFRGWARSLRRHDRPVRLQALTLRQEARAWRRLPLAAEQAGPDHLFAE